MEITHDLLHLHKWSFVQWKIMDIPTSFIWIIILFDEGCKFGNDVEFWGCVGTNADPLCI
jgi:hypothetical protein